jgi:hypothetical protein
MPTSPSAYSTAPPMSTRKPPKRSASMPAKMPNMPHDRFCTAMAKAKVSRVQPCSWVMGCSHRPKPWRMPMDKVTMAAPQASTCRAESLGGWKTSRDCSEFARRLPVAAVAPAVSTIQRHGREIRIFRRTGCGLWRIVHPGAQGPGARQAAPGHVHPHRQPAARRPGGARQRGRRSAGRLRQEDQGHAARRWLGERGGRRARHSPRPAPRRKRPGAGAGVHPAARGRQVRQGQGRGLQLLGRPAWRGRERDQRTGHPAGSEQPPRRPPGPPGVCRWRCGGSPDAPPAGSGRAQAGHHGACVARRQVLRVGRAAHERTGAPAAQQGGADAWRAGEPGERKNRRHANLAVQRRACATTCSKR